MRSLRALCERKKPISGKCSNCRWNRSANMSQTQIPNRRRISSSKPMSITANFSSGSGIEIHGKGTPMEKDVKVCENEVQISEELLTSFAKFLAPEIHKFCESEKRKCKKKIITKQLIEDRVVAKCLSLLIKENIVFIAKAVAEECNKSSDSFSVKALKKAIQEADIAIENLWRGIEQGQSVAMLTERLNQRKAEKEELEEQLAIKQNRNICLTELQIYAFLDYVRKLPADDVNKRRAIINIFVHSIYLYDDYFTLILNASRRPLRIENIPLNDIEAAFSGDTYTSIECSSIKPSAPPKH